MGNWSISRIYLYLVALITFVVLLSNFIGLVRSIPDYFLGGEMDGPATPISRGFYSIGPDKSEITYTDKEMQAYLEERKEESQKMQKRIYLRNMLTNTLSFLVLLPIHIYYLKLAFKTDKKINSV